jgi:hypothetical protein
MPIRRHPKADAIFGQPPRLWPRTCWIRTPIFTRRGLGPTDPSKKPLADSRLLLSRLAHRRGIGQPAFQLKQREGIPSLHGPRTMLQVHASVHGCALTIKLAQAFNRQPCYCRISACRRGSTRRVRFSCARLTSSSVRVRSLARYLSDNAMLFLSGGIPSPV